MTGRQRTTTSPSSVSSNRSTPCVEGCCGPMLTVSRSRSLTAIDPPRDGEVDGLAAERLSPPQREPFPAVRQHDPRQIGVTLEVDAKQIKELPLVPVGAWNLRRDARCLTVRGRL